MKLLSAVALATAIQSVLIGGPADAATTTAAAPAATTATVTSSQVSAAATTKAAAALAVTPAGIINAATYGMTCSNNQTLGADGLTPDTDGFRSAIAAAAAVSYGVEIVLPPGVCALNAEIDIPTTQSLRLTGAGIGTTILAFMHAPGGAAPPNGVIITPSNGSAVTVDHFTIGKMAGTNNGAPQIGTALGIEAAIVSPNVGPVTVSDLSIVPAAPSAQTDGWNISLLERNLADPVIDNVSISMPGWGTIPDPGGYACNGAPCAIHALASPANLVATPPALAFGNAVGIALEGVGAGNYQIDTVIEGVTMSGGLAGLDLQQFQGVYIDNSRFTAEVYGIRADTPGTTSELLAVENSEFTNTVGGIYANGLGGTQITGSFFWPGDAGTPNLPGWTGIWARNGNSTTISGNNVIGGGNSAEAEWGIYLSSDVANGFPIAVTGNTIYGLSATGSVCLGNNALQQTINASGNSLFSCATYVSDKNGNNAYADNILQYPDMYDDGSRDLTFAKSVTIGTAYDPGSLTIDNAGHTTLAVDSAGDLNSAGAVVAAGSVSSGGAVTGASLDTAGALQFTGNPSHYASQMVVGNFYFPYGGGSHTFTLNAPSGSFPSLSGGVATISGELTCNTSGGDIASWRVVGHYVAGSPNPSVRAFSATIEADADSTKFMQDHAGNLAVTPVANVTAPGLAVTVGPSTSEVLDCTSLLSEMVEN